MSRYVLKGELGVQKARECLERHIESGATIDIVKKRRPRTNNQNAYYWVLIQLLGIEVGYTKDEMAIVVKRELQFWYEVNGQKFVRSTADLNIEEMAKYIERMKNWAASLGHKLPSAQQYWERRDEYDSYIDANAYVRGER